MSFSHERLKALLAIVLLAPAVYTAGFGWALFLAAIFTAYQQRLEAAAWWLALVFIAISMAGSFAGLTEMAEFAGSLSMVALAVYILVSIAVFASLGSPPSAGNNED